MKKIVFFLIALLLAVLIFWSFRNVSVLNAGKAGFTQHCGTCHAGGGNRINPQKTLSRKDLSANGISTPGDVVVKIRNHRPGQIRFDELMIPDEEAEAIGRYVLKTFH